MIFETADLTIYIFIFHFILELMTMFKEILKASRNNQASIFTFTFKFKEFICLTCLGENGFTQHSLGEKLEMAKQLTNPI